MVQSPPLRQPVRFPGIGFKGPGEPFGTAIWFKGNHQSLGKPPVGLSSFVFFFTAFVGFYCVSPSVLLGNHQKKTTTMGGQPGQTQSCRFEGGKFGSRGPWTSAALCRASCSPAAPQRLGIPWISGHWELRGAALFFSSRIYQPHCGPTLGFTFFFLVFFFLHGSINLIVDQPWGLRFFSSFFFFFTDLSTSLWTNLGVYVLFPRVVFLHGSINLIVDQPWGLRFFSSFFFFLHGSINLIVDQPWGLRFCFLVFVFSPRIYQPHCGPTLGFTFFFLVFCFSPRIYQPHCGPTLGFTFFFLVFFFSTDLSTSLWTNLGVYVFFPRFFSSTDLSTSLWTNLGVYVFFLLVVFFSTDLSTSLWTNLGVYVFFLVVFFFTDLSTSLWTNLGIYVFFPRFFFFFLHGSMNLIVDQPWVYVFFSSFFFFSPRIYQPHCGPTLGFTFFLIFGVKPGTS